jgi:hypothetical protein
VFANRVLRRMFGTKRDEVKEDEKHAKAIGGKGRRKETTLIQNRRQNCAFGLLAKGWRSCIVASCCTRLTFININ